MNKKRIIQVLATLVLLFFVGSFVHTYLLSTIPTRFLPISIYGFHALATFIVFIMVELSIKKYADQTGYLYLVFMMVKLGLFAFIFRYALFSEVPLTNPEKLILILPLIIFLTIEAIMVSKVLNSKVFKG